MSLAEFYSIRSQSSEVADGVTKIAAAISINPSHPIFQGHFPGQPVVPGVCMMQIVRELMTAGIGSSLVLAEAVNVKFLAILDPQAQPDVMVEVLVSVKGTGYASTSRIYLENTTFFKMEAVFQASLFKLPGPLSP